MPPLAAGLPWDFLGIAGPIRSIMERNLDDAAALPPGRFAEIRFEDFERDPIAELDRIHRTLGLPGWAQALPHFRAYLQGIRGYTKNTHSYPGDEVARVARH